MSVVAAAAATAYDWDGPGVQERFAAGDDAVSAGDAKGKRSRQTYSKYQTAVLETVFQTSKYIVRSRRQQMSAELSLTERQIKIWFQNRRMKEKKNRKETAAVRVDAGFGYAPCDAVGYGDGPPQNGPFACGYPARSERDGTYASGYPATDRDDRGGYADYAGGYDAPAPESERYVAKQQWPVVADFGRDFYSEPDVVHFQRLPMTHHHHHHTLNSQVSDFCPPQLQTHGY